MNNKRFMKGFGLLLVVALLVSVLPLQAKAQTGGNTLYVADWSEPAATGRTGRETVLKVGDTYHMWYSADEETLFHTSSTNPASFVAGTAVTFTGGVPVEVGSVSVVKEGDKFYMIAYGVDNTEFAIYTSTDGTAWTKGGVVFDGTDKFTNFVKIDAPFLFKLDSGYRLYFQVKTGTGATERYHIYAAESSTIGGIYTLVNGGNPVLSPDTDITKWDGKYVMHPWVVKDGDVYYMWYSAHNGNLAHRLGMAKSTDGLNWVKSPGNPILPEPTAGYAEPSVIKDGNTWRMWLIARTGDGVVYYDASGPFEFSSIQAAINAASAGDTILVWPGTYNENLTINKPLTLKAATTDVMIDGSASNNNTLDNSVASPLIKITSQDVNLVGLTLDGYAVAVVVDTRIATREESLTSRAHWNIEYCSFIDNAINIVNLTDFKVMAENNWWGSHEGPERGSIIGDVDYIPWLLFSGLELDENEIEENKPAGTLVGTFEITDPEDDGVYTLALANSELYPDNDLFTIDDDFNLKSTAELNFEDPEHDPTYTIYVRVTDSWDNIWEGEFDIAVIDVNEDPVLAEIGDQEVDELDTLEFVATADDEDTNPTWKALTFSLEDGDEGEVPVGAGITTGGAFSWKPTEAQGPGKYTFDVCVWDGGEVGKGLSDCETITITVNEVNMAPVAKSDAYNVLTGTKLEVPAPGVLGNDTDEDLPENTLSAVLVLPPAGGDFVLNPDGSFEFTPPDPATTSYEFRYKVSDGAGKESAEAKVTLTIKNTNDVPTDLKLTDLEWNEETEEPYKSTLSVTDDDADAPSLQHIYSFATGLGDEDNDKFDIEGNQLIAKAPFDYETQKQYKVRIQATDFFDDSVVNSFTITVVDVNDAPVLAEIGDKEVDELDKLEFVAKATDADIPVQALEFSLADGDEGEVPVGAGITAGGAFSWTPTEEQGPGEYTFDVCVSDGALEDCETITITVNEVNEAPYWKETLPESITINEESPETIELSEYASDDDAPGQTLEFSLAGEVPDGAKITKAGVFTWKPSEEQGPDEYTFTVKVCDDGEPVLCDEEEITIKVLEVNVAPVANEDSYAVTGNQLVVPAPGVLANDTDADIPANRLTVELVTESAPEGLTLYSNGSFAYTKPDDEEGDYVNFAYTVFDGTEYSEAATVTLLLKNSPPVRIDLDRTEIEENEEFVGVLTTVDPTEADVHTYTLVDSCEGALDNDEFTIEEDEDGNDVLRANELFDYETKNSYSVCVRSTDLFGEYVDAKFDIRVIDVNEAPEAKSQPDLTTIVNTPLEITLEGIDPEGSELTYAVFSFPAHGTLSMTEVPSINNFADNGVLAVVLRNLTYTPDPDYVGVDSFTFKVMDATGLVSNLANVTITVGEANKPPVADDLFVETMENQPVEIELIATDPDGDPLTFEIVIDPEHGTLECEGSLCTYTPEAGWSGTDFFTYIANDGELDSNEATVEITVHPLPIFRIYLPLISK